jgi:hypothetical protein
MNGTCASYACFSSLRVASKSDLSADVQEIVSRALQD